MARLIMLYGASPGAGKTTLGVGLRDYFEQHQQVVEWLEEDSVEQLDIFRPVVGVFREGQGNAVGVILDVARRFVQLYAEQEGQVITDSLFPCYTWLYAHGVPEPMLEAFSLQLAEVLRPLSPVLVFLDGDGGWLLKRAIAERGENWQRDIIESVASYRNVPIRPVASLDEVVAFFAATHQLALRLLSAWPHPVVRLDVTDMMLDEVQSAVLQALT